jgi:hypothetical protein
MEKVKRVFMMALEFEGNMESIRESIQRSVPISLRQIFDHLDWIKRGFLTSSEFRRYFDDYPDETEQMRHGGERAF